MRNTIMLGGNQKVRIYKMKNFENRNALTKETWEINRLRKALNEADAVIIGAGAGLSTAAGHVYDGERFERYFNDATETTQSIWNSKQ